MLTLIKRRGAHMALHPGDLDYGNRPERFEERIDALLGRDFPYFFTPGVTVGLEKGRCEGANNERCNMI